MRCCGDGRFGRALWGLVAMGCAAPGPEQLAVDQGLDVYLGQTAVTDTRTEGDTTTFTFDPDTGPRCMRGDPFRMATRDAGSEDLLIFLQGGGACWSEFCFAVTRAPEGMPGVDVLRTDLPDNPVADWNVAYLPYCDGSLFVGDRDHDDDGDGAPDRFHRGLANVSAALDQAAAAFPEPRRVLLAGSSGGGFGALLHMPLVRHVFPDAELIVLSDSGVGVARGEADPGFVGRLMDEFDASRFLAPDCEGCLASGHISPLADWYLGHDPEARIGVFSSWYDGIIGDVFLQVPAAAFQADIAAETGRTNASFPDRYRRFIVDGRMHTTLLGNPTGIVGSDLSAVEIPPALFSGLAGFELGTLSTTAIGDVGVSGWFRGLVDGDLQRWPDLLDTVGPDPDAAAP